MSLHNRSHKEGWYDIAQVCLNGHMLNNSTKVAPEHNRKFCDKCGAATITKCPRCEAHIPGQFHATGTFVFSIPMHVVPKFCSHCGAPYPWTENRLKAAHDLANEITEISEDERDILNQSLDELVKDTPQTKVAIVRFKKIVSKAGKEVANAFREILIDIVSEAVRKMIWP